MKLSTTQMFLMGAGIALVGAVAFSMFKSETPIPGQAPGAVQNTTGDSTSYFQSLFGGNNQPASAGQKPEPYVPPARNAKTDTNTVQKVTYSTPGDIDMLAARYPFLKAEADNIKMERTSPDIFPLPMGLSYAEFEDAATDARVLLVELGGGSACGSAGCYTTIYVDNGRGFENPGYAFSAAGELYYRNENSTGLAIFNCARDGVEEFRLSPQGIQQIKPASIQAASLPGCN